MHNVQTEMPCSLFTLQMISHCITATGDSSFANVPLWTIAFVGHHTNDQTHLNKRFLKRYA